jgi:hypothetical protein
MSKPASKPGWLALSDLGLLAGQPESGLLHRGQFVIELAMPLQGHCLLIDHKSNAGWPRTFAAVYDPTAGFVLVHRQGARVVRHVLSAPLPQGKGHGRLTFAFDAPAKLWSLRFEVLGAEASPAIEARGRDPLPMLIEDLAALCATGRPRSGVLWFGATTGDQLPGQTAWIGLRSQIETSLGPAFAGNLRAGDVVMTLDRGPQILRAVTPLSLPARGSYAPVLLRAPYFGQMRDLLVSADQLVAISGPEAEYLFDAESVLMPAGALVDGRTALADDRRAVTGSVALDLGGPALIESDGCILALGHDAARDLPLRAIKPYEVLTLMSLLGRAPRAAA